MLGLAAWLTAAPAAAYLSLGTLAHDLAEAGPIGVYGGSLVVRAPIEKHRDGGCNPGVAWMVLRR